MSDNEPKTRQEKKGNKHKNVYNDKSIRIQERLREANANKKKFSEKEQPNNNKK